MIKMDVKEEKRKIDKARAKHYLTFNNLIGQRVPKEFRIEELYEKYKAGLFHVATIHFALCNELQKVFLMDGQHCLMMIEKYDCVVSAHIVSHECDSKEDLTVLFDQFEILRRSQTDSVRVRHEILGLEKKWPLWISEIIVSTAALEKALGDTWNYSRLTPSTSASAKRSKNKKMTKDTKMGLLKDYLEFAQFYFSLVRDERTQSASKIKLKHMAKVAVVFMVLKTYRINKNDASIFWTRVAFGEDLKISRPEYKLREFLVYSGRGIKNEPKFCIRISNHEIAYRTALAWNSFRKNLTTSLAYRFTNPIPKLI